MSTDLEILRSIINQFADDQQRIDKEALRVFVLTYFENFHKKYEYIMSHPHNRELWNQIQDLVISTGSEKEKAAINDLRQLDTYLHSWREQHLDTPERFEFSIQLKATEIASGDAEFDYFAALMIRHDQLLAAVQVFQSALDHFETILSLSIDTFRDHDSFVFFCEKNLDARIFEIAEQIYRLRGGE